MDKLEILEKNIADLQEKLCSLETIIINKKLLPSSHDSKNNNTVIIICGEKSWSMDKKEFYRDTSNKNFLDLPNEYILDLPLSKKQFREFVMYLKYNIIPNMETEYDIRMWSKICYVKGFNMDIKYFSSIDKIKHKTSMF